MGRTEYEFELPGGRTIGMRELGADDFLMAARLAPSEPTVRAQLVSLGTEGLRLAVTSDGGKALSYADLAGSQLSKRFDTKASLHLTKQFGRINEATDAERRAALMAPWVLLEGADVRQVVVPLPGERTVTLREATLDDFTRAERVTPPERNPFAGNVLNAAVNLALSLVSDGGPWSGDPSSKTVEAFLGERFSWKELRLLMQVFDAGHGVSDEEADAVSDSLRVVVR